MIERAGHLPTVLLMLSFVLVMDVGVSLRYGSTLRSLNLAGFQQYITVGDVLIFVVIFGLFMSVCVKFFKILADMLVLIAVRPYWKRWFHHDDGKPPFCGAVRPYALREAAHLEQNKFYLDLYNTHELIQGANSDQEYKLALMAFACFMLGVVNYLILPWYGYPTIFLQIATYFPGLWKVFFSLYSIFLLAIWLYPLLRDDIATDWVYCLQLYHKTEDKKRENQLLLHRPIPRNAAEQRK